MCCDLVFLAQCLIVQVYFLFACAKGVVGGAISGAVQCICFLVIAIALLPHDICVTYYSAARTKMLGPWLKTLCLLLLPVPLLTWPLWAALAGLFIGFCTTAGILITARHSAKSRSKGWPGVMDWLTLPVTGWSEACKQSGQNIESFADFNYNSYFAYLSKVREHPGPPFDISPVRLVASLAVSLVGAVLGLVCGLVQLPKFPIILLKVWGEILKSYVKLDSGTEMVVLLVPYILVMALTPVALALALAMLLLGCLMSGSVWAGIQGYQAPTMADMAWHGLAHAWNLFHELEKCVDDFIGFRCLPLFATKLPLPDYNTKPHQHQHQEPFNAPADLEQPEQPEQRSGGSSPKAGDSKPGVVAAKDVVMAEQAAEATAQQEQPAGEAGGQVVVEDATAAAQEGTVSIHVQPADDQDQGSAQEGPAAQT